MNRSITLICFLLVLIVLPFSSNARKLYISTELGLGIGNSIDTGASGNDLPTLCDQHLDPDNLFSATGVTEPEGCSSASTWSNGFDGSIGVIAGLALGIRADFGASIEAEHFNSGAQYNETSALGGSGADLEDKSQQELIRGIGEVNINSLFVNVYYDLPVSGRLRPYVGGGVGGLRDDRNGI